MKLFFFYVTGKFLNDVIDGRYKLFDFRKYPEYYKLQNLYLIKQN